MSIVGMFDEGSWRRSSCGNSWTIIVGMLRSVESLNVAGRSLRVAEVGRVVE